MFKDWPNCFVIGVMLLAGCGVTEFRDQRIRLEPLLATNAPLTAVKAEIGEIQIYQAGTPEWNDFRSYYMRRSNHYAGLASKMEKSASFGWKSTASMQTWIFLDEQERLIDFEVGAQ